MKKMNIGLVGAGFMGKAHMVAFSNMPKLFTDAPFIPVFKTVCDIVPEIAEDFKERYGFEKACTDWMDIINDPEIDIVSVCTPNNEHAAVSIAALKAGKHVICEKPIASTTEDAKAMAEAAAEAAKKGIVSMNGYQYRRVPAIDEAKKIIESGRLGELTNIRTQYLQSWSADPSSPLSWRFEKQLPEQEHLVILLHMHWILLSILQEIFLKLFLLLKHISLNVRYRRAELTFLVL